MTIATAIERRRLVRRGKFLTWGTLLYNSLEGLLAVGAGLLAGSVALVGFGVDSAIELCASAAGLWRLHADLDPTTRERAELRTRRLIGLSFLALAAYVGGDAFHALITRAAPRESPVGIAIATASLIVMPLLARAKRAVALRLESGALAAEARQTEICMYLSAILLGGLALNAILGWWWADPAAALTMVPLIAREGIEGVRGRDTCNDRPGDRDRL